MAAAVASIARPLCGTRLRRAGFNINNMESRSHLTRLRLDAPVLSSSRGRGPTPSIMRNMMCGHRDLSAIPVWVHSIRQRARHLQTAIQAVFTSVRWRLAEGRRQSPAMDYLSGSPETRHRHGPSRRHSVEGRKRVRARSIQAGDKEDATGGGQPPRPVAPNPTKPQVRQETNVDVWRLRWDSHGAYKFTRKPDGDILALPYRDIHAIANSSGCMARRRCRRTCRTSSTPMAAR